MVYMSFILDVPSDRQVQDEHGVNMIIPLLLLHFAYYKNENFS